MTRIECLNLVGSWELGVRSEEFGVLVELGIVNFYVKF